MNSSSRTMRFAARFTAAALACAGLILATGLPAAHAELVSHGKFQNINVYKPKGEVTGVVLLLSGDHGWDQRATQMAHALTDMGAMVAGINTQDLMAKLEADGGTCTFPDGDLENLSRFLQAYERLPGYIPPVLAAEGEGAALAYTVVAGTSADIFSGLLTFDFCPELALKKPLCKGGGVNFKKRDAGAATGAESGRIKNRILPVAPVTSIASVASVAPPTPAAAGARTSIGTAATVVYTPNNHGIDLLPAKTLRLPWIALQHRTDSELPGEMTHFPSCHARVAQAFVSSVPGTELQLLPAPSQNPLAGSGMFPQWKAAYIRLNAKRAPAPAPVPAAVHDLPIVEVPATGRNAAVGDQTLAIFMSGDGGWAGIDREVAGVLAKNGVPVVGVDSLRYFWSARTPASTAADVERLMHFYLAQWHKTRVILVGYSQGADVLPFVINRLSAEARSKLALGAMLALGRKADFQFRLSNWLKNSNDGLPIQPEVDKLVSGRFLCVYGSQETDSGCPGALRPAAAPGTDPVAVVKLIGGHHFDGDNVALGNRILNAAR